MLKVPNWEKFNNWRTKLWKFKVWSVLEVILTGTKCNLPYLIRVKSKDWRHSMLIYATDARPHIPHTTTTNTSQENQNL